MLALLNLNFLRPGNIALSATIYCCIQYDAKAITTDSDGHSEKC